ncbi:MAG TPA: hypothetical protein DET40_02130 [Lentisphaeria bacterium]|nr:MAG: hypothetical protein A2X45_10240 [Lentisphaerae bacterium GWF2_50_93]HCE42330.1 hypothetical protein [Lentisphaeria bacterium]
MKTVSRFMAIMCILGFSIAAMAEEKVVWSAKDSIGKTQTWKTKAMADVANDALNIKLSDTEWSGVGLNWEGYWPEDAGVKASDYKFLVIELKADGNSDTLQVALKDNKHKPSGSVEVKKYCPDNKLPADFKTIKIPIADLLTDKSEFVSGVAWELMVHMWTQDAKNVNVSIRKIAFSKE